MKTFTRKPGNLILAVAMVSSLWACSNNDEVVSKKSQSSTADKLLQQRVATAAENTQMVSAAMDVFETTSASLVAKGVAGGRVSSFGSKTSGDGVCLPDLSGSFNIESSNSDSVVYTGSIVLNYGAGFSCPGSAEIHKGKITDNFRLVLSNSEGSNYVLTEHIAFDAFQLDSVMVEGSFTGVSKRGTTSVSIENAKLTYANGTTAMLNASLYSILITNEAGSTSKEVSGSLSGVSVDGISYSAVSAKSLVFDYSCSPDVPVTGVVDINIGGTISSLDYGTGVCDKKYMIVTSDSITVHEFTY